MKQIKKVSYSLFLLFFIASYSEAQNTIKNDDLASLRQGTAIEKLLEEPATLQNPSNKDIRKKRAYPMQPPSIPHHIDGYQINLNANKCLSCHARNQTEESQAPMVSVTHFMDRDGNFLADVSPRRYFCTQCHTTQIERKPLIENTFKDITELLTSPKLK
ncbi:MAG: nitrate reductase cytochrome c-type subunit [Cellvibrionaceae bacterium]